MALPVLSLSWTETSVPVPTGATAYRITIENHSPETVTGFLMSFSKEPHSRGWYEAYGLKCMSVPEGVTATYKDIQAAGNVKWGVVQPGGTAINEGSVFTTEAATGMYISAYYEGELFQMLVDFDTPIPALSEPTLTGDLTVEAFHKATGDFIEGITITIDGMTKKTDDKGKAIFSDVKVNVYYDIYASKEGWVTTNKQQLVTAFPATTQIALNKVSEVPVNWVEGTIREKLDGSTGPKLDGVRVEVGGKTTSTDEYGYYKVVLYCDSVSCCSSWDWNTCFCPA